MGRLLVSSVFAFLWGCSGDDSPSGGGGGSNAPESGGASTGGALVNTGSGSSTGGTAGGGGSPANGGVTTGGGGFVGGACNPGCGSGGSATGVGGTGRGGSDPFVVRVTALCGAACKSIAEAPGCPDLGADCSRDCTTDRTEALKLGCSFEPVLDCADEHPDANRYFCDENGIRAFDLESCAEVLDAYNGCVLAAKGQQ